MSGFVMRFEPDGKWYKISKECPWSWCKTCECYAEFESVCTNRDSPYVAEVVDEDNTFCCHERKGD